MEIAVLLLLWKRPELLDLVIEPLRKARVSRMYIAVDGANDDEEVRNDVCRVKEKVLKIIDWDCVIKTRYADTNMGCKMAVSSALDWFFENESEGIIIEDDVIVDESFIGFAKELLERHRDDATVGSISACSYNSRLHAGTAYDFSSFVHVWGWASWRRVWNLYSSDLSKVNLTSLEKSLDKYAVSMGSDFKGFWMKKFKEMKECKIDTWDYQLQLLFLEKGLLSCTPTEPMSSNIGFGSKATHTFSISTDQLVDIESKSKPKEESELGHPEMVANIPRDQETFRSNFCPSFMTRAKRKLKMLYRRG